MAHPLLDPATSGFDVSVQLRGNFVRHVVQLFADTGTVPMAFDTPNGSDITLQAAPENQLRRGYEAFPGAALPTDGGAFLGSVGGTSSDGDRVLLELQLVTGAGFRQLVVLRLQQEIDLAAAFADLLAYLNEETDEDGNDIEFDILSFVDVPAVYEPLYGYDRDNPEASNLALEGADIAGTLNTGLVEAIDSMRGNRDDFEEVYEILEAQADALSLVRFDRVEFRVFEQEQVLGIYLNLILIDPDGGEIAERGASDDDGVFLPDGDDFAVTTGLGFAENIARDLVIKFAHQMAIDAETVTEDEVIDDLDEAQFPLYIPMEEAAITVPALFEDAEDIVIPIDIAIAAVELDTQPVDQDGTAVSALRLTVKTDETIAGFLGIADENLVAWLVPQIRSIDGLSAADVALTLDVQVDLVRSLFELSWFPKQLAIPFVALFNFFVANPEADKLEGLLSEQGFDQLSWLPLEQHRWDAFYLTHHGLDFEASNWLFSDNRVFFSGVPHLGRRVEPIEDVQVRAVDYATAGDAIERLRYRVGNLDDVRDDAHHATDRQRFVVEVDDAQDSIVSLAYQAPVDGSCLDRLASGRLMPDLPYAPYKVSYDDSRINRLQLLSEQEYGRLRRRLRRRFLDDLTNDFIDNLEPVFGTELDEESRDELFDTMRDLLAGDQTYLDYIDEELDDDTLELVLTDGETLRLTVSPSDLYEFQEQGVLLMPGFEAVMRNGRVYFRDIYTRDEGAAHLDDNLESLPPI